MSLLSHRPFRPFLAAAALLALGGCATVISGPFKDVTVLTPGATDAVCLVSNGSQVYRLENGETRKIMRQPHDLSVRCQAEGNRNVAAVFSLKANRWAMLDALTGVAPGVAYDHFARGLYDYPGTIVVDFRDESLSSYDLPDYNSPELEMRESWEYMGPGTPAHPDDPDMVPIRKKVFINESPLGSSTARSAPPPPPRFIPPEPRYAAPGGPNDRDK